MIEVKNLTKSFDGRVVIDDISSRFKKGCVNIIIGKSGSGKTVFLKNLIGLLIPDHGEVLYAGKDFLKMRKSDIKKLRKNMGMLFQGSALFDSKTVLENVSFPLDIFSKKNKKDRIKRAEFCLERVGLEGSNNLYPSEISGGMMKRVAIARAIALNPHYLFCDEPNSGLDPNTSQLIDELIRDITKDYGMTTLVVTHDMNSVMNIGDHIMYIHEGKKEWEGSKTEIVNADNVALKEFMFASDVFKKGKETKSEIKNQLAKK